MAFMQNAMQFYSFRFLLGMAESGFAPGVIYYISQWMPRRFRAWAIAGSMLAIPISGISGWRWMYLVEGGLTVLAAFASLRVFVDTPAEARWLDSGQKQWLLAELEQDRARIPQGNQGTGELRRMLCSIRIWASAGVWFSLMSGAYGIMYWLPQIIKQVSKASDFKVSILSTLPWIGLGTGMLLNAWHSDKTQERYWHIGIPALMAAAGMILGTSVSSGWLALCCLVIGGIGLGGAQGAFWALPTSILGGANAGNGITLINILGTSGGLLTPPVIGWVRVHTGSFAASAYLLAGLLIGGAALLVPIYRAQGRDTI
jgi:ACS family tartrate transporter-like MFS transporter